VPVTLQLGQEMLLAFDDPSCSRDVADRDL
jgi:hypothetical protein